MPKIVYSGPHRAVEVNGVVCQYGEEVAFSADVAASLLEQDVWTKPAQAPGPDAPCLGVVDYDALADQAAAERAAAARAAADETVSDSPAVPAEESQS